jgi:signal peptidase II
LTATDRWARALALCGAVVALDQGAKALVQAHLVPGERVEIGLGFHLVDVHNRGAAFGLFAGGQAPVIAVSLGAVLLIGVYLWRHLDRPWLWLSAGLLAGGAFGNLADRLRIDSVTDFIDPPLWPAFNVADIAIVAGVAVLLLTLSESPKQTARGGGPAPERSSEL